LFWSKNSITANGDCGMLTYYKGTDLYTNIVLSDNLFNGKTYVGTPMDGALFSHGNVPRYGLGINAGVDGFYAINNSFTVTSGEMVSGHGIGRGTIWTDAKNVSFVENYFAPTLAAGWTSGTAYDRGIIMEASTGMVITCNFFSLANGNDAKYYIISYGSPAGYVVNNVASGNTFQFPGGIISGDNIGSNAYFSGTAANSTNPADGCSIVSLPVQFGAIFAQVFNNLLQINWTALQEKNCDYYEIEASTDGITFTPIGKVESKAETINSNHSMDYSFSTDLSQSTLLGFSILAFAGLIFLKFRPRKWMQVCIVAAILVLIGIGCKKQVGNIDSSTIDKLLIRIAQVDKNGSKTYTKAINVNTK